MSRQNADDLAELVDHLDLKDAIHVGHSSTKRVAKAVLIGAVPPVMIKKPPIPAVRRSKSSIKFAPACSPTARNTGRTSPCHSTAITGRTRRSPKACASRSGCKAWPGCRPAIFCVKAISETDLTEDLKKFDVPTLVLHGDDDQIVPIADAGALTAKIVKNAKFVVVRAHQIQRPARRVADRSWPLLQIQRDKARIAGAIGDKEHRDLFALRLERVEPRLHIVRTADRLVLHLDNDVAGRQPFVRIGQRNARIDAGDKHAVDAALDLKFAALIVGKC